MIFTIDNYIHDCEVEHLEIDSTERFMKFQIKLIDPNSTVYHRLMFLYRDGNRCVLGITYVNGHQLPFRPELTTERRARREDVDFNCSITQIYYDFKDIYDEHREFLKSIEYRWS